MSRELLHKTIENVIRMMVIISIVVLTGCGKRPVPTPPEPTPSPDPEPPTQKTLTINQVTLLSPAQYPEPFRVVAREIDNKQIND